MSDATAVLPPSHANIHEIVVQPVSLPTFNLGAIQSGDLVLSQGRRGVGKTSLLLRILDHYDRNGNLHCEVIHPCDDANPAYGPRQSGTIKLTTNMTPAIINEIIAGQAAAVENCRNQFYEVFPNGTEQDFRDYVLSGNAGKHDPRLLLILDDCMFDNTWQTSETWQALCTDREELFITICISLQYPLELSNIRHMTKYVFIHREHNHQLLGRLHATFASGMVYQDFCNALHAATPRVGDALVIQYNNLENDRNNISLFHYQGTP